MNYKNYIAIKKKIKNIKNIDKYDTCDKSSTNHSDIIETAKVVLDEQLANKCEIDKITYLEEYIAFYNINQIYVSKGLYFLTERILRKYNLVSYNDINRPAIFFGIYFEIDIDTVMNHRGQHFIMFGGTDASRGYKVSQDIIKWIKTNDTSTVISISHNIYQRLNDLNIGSKLLEFNLVDKNVFNKKLYPNKGSKIYIYNGFSKERGEIYGKEFYDEVMKKLPQFEYIQSCHINAKYEEMGEIYAQCFIGMRLTHNDGNANTVQEFEAMNIPIIHNQSDYGIKWGSVNDIINIIIENCR